MTPMKRMRAGPMRLVRTVVAFSILVLKEEFLQDLVDIEQGNKAQLRHDLSSRFRRE